MIRGKYYIYTFNKMTSLNRRKGQGFASYDKPVPEPVPKEMYKESLVEFRNPSVYREQFDMIHAKTEMKKKELQRGIEMERRKS